MKKLIAYITLALLVTISFVACNDGTEGLISKAMTAKKEESHNILYILGRNEDASLLFVSTNEGIYSYSGDGNFAYIEGKGNSAKNTLYYDGTTKIYKDQNKYYRVAKQSEPVEITELKDMTLTNMYSPDGISFTYRFIDNNNKTIGFYAKSTDGVENLFKNPVELPDNASLVGNGGFAYKDGDSYFVKSIKTGSETAQKCDKTPITGYVEANGNWVATTANNDYFYTGKFNDLSSKSSSKPSVAISNDAEYIFFPHSSTYVAAKEKGEIKPSNGGLDSISVLSAIKNINESNKYLLISTSNGAFILDTSAKTLNKINKINFSEYVY